MLFGAVGDLDGDGTGATLSPALSRIAAPGVIPIKTAFIVGFARDANFVIPPSCTFCGRGIILRFCTDSDPNIHSDPLAVALTTPTGWPALFPASGSDVIVPVISQVNGLTASSYSQFEGYVHSPGIVGEHGLGFTGPSVLDADAVSGVAPVARQVIKLLNTPITQPVFNPLNP